VFWWISLYYPEIIVRTFFIRIFITLFIEKYFVYANHLRSNHPTSVAITNKEDADTNTTSVTIRRSTNRITKVENLVGWFIIIVRSSFREQTVEVKRKRKADNVKCLQCSAVFKVILLATYFAAICRVTNQNISDQESEICSYCKLKNYFKLLLYLGN
jgi:hypothetical protein